MNLIWGNTFYDYVINFQNLVIIIENDIRRIIYGIFHLNMIAV